MVNISIPFEEDDQVQSEKCKVRIVRSAQCSAQDGRERYPAPLLSRHSPLAIVRGERARNRQGVAKGISLASGAVSPRGLK